MNRRVWVNFKELRQSLRFEDVLRHYGVEVRRRGDQHQGVCPLPLHSGRGSAHCFSANLERGVYQCFGCGSKGNLLEFACRMTGHEPSDADALRAVAVELQMKFLSAGAERGAKTAQVVPSGAPAKTVINAPLDFELKALDVGHAYLAARGFSRETLKHFGVGFCSRGSLKGRVAIPIHDDEGRLLGYAGRSTSDSEHSESDPKYLLPARRELGGTVYELRIDRLLYNGHIILRPTSALVVVTGYSAVWWLTQAGLPACVATMGASCSEHQAELIVNKTDERGTVWVMPPGSPAGERFAAEIFRMISPLRAVRWVRLGDGRKPTDVPVLTIKETVRL